MLDRRSVLASAAAIAATRLRRVVPAKGAGLEDGSGTRPASRHVPIANPGLQLYTLRDLMAEDLPGTLAAVAQIGYREVEFAGYFGRSPTEIRALLDRNELRAPSGHVDLSSLRTNRAKVFDLARTVGHEWVIVAWIPPLERGNADGWRRLADEFNRLGEAANAMGLRFGYHNHDFEFSATDGQLPFDILLQRTEQGLVTFELDFYWITRAGHDAAHYLRHGSGRFTLVHVKDMEAAGGRGMADPGAGVIDFGTLLPLARKAGVRHWFIEHDSTPDPLGTARVGYAFLRSAEV